VHITFKDVAPYRDGGPALKWHRKDGGIRRGCRSGDVIADRTGSGMGPMRRCPPTVKPWSLKTRESCLMKQERSKPGVRGGGIEEGGKGKRVVRLGVSCQSQKVSTWRCKTACRQARSSQEVQISMGQGPSAAWGRREVSLKAGVAERKNPLQQSSAEKYNSTAQCSSYPSALGVLKMLFVSQTRKRPWIKTVTTS